jgi:hypothetical protein
MFVHDDEEEERTHVWITAIIEGTNLCTVPNDYGLSEIADHVGKSDAVALYWEGAQKEENQDIPGAMLLYQRAYRIWPALDSIHQGGLPYGVREETKASNFSSCILLGIITVGEARASKVMHAPALLNASDIRDIEAVKQGMVDIETPVVNNPQNVTHQCKVCTFLNNPPSHAMRTDAPHVLDKMLRFGRQAWLEANWNGDANMPGPLHEIGLSSLSIRVAEHWEYSVGGGLDDPLHYDVDSVVTLVALLSDENDFEGGTFRTYEIDDTQLDHPMRQGDVICFLSHKYHNVVKVSRGTRRSFVMELWQGGLGHKGR